MSTTGITCVSCDNSIEPGHVRHPTDEGPIHDACEKQRRAVESYNLYVMSPDHHEGTEWSLWYDHGPFETPLFNEGNCGFSVCTVDSDHGDAIPVTESFVNAVAYGYHTAVSFMQSIDGDDVQRTIENMYDHPIPEQDRWAIHHAIWMMRTKDNLPPEFRELVDYTDAITGFGTPDVSPSPLGVDGC